jgi:hypothetical protein
MRESQKQQQQQNPELYRNRVNTQQRKYRLRVPKLYSILRTRIMSKKRQRRHRLNQSNEQKSLHKEKSRQNKRLKRKQQRKQQSKQQLSQCNDSSTITELNKLES